LIDPVEPGLWDDGLPLGTVGYCIGLALAIGALTGRAASGLAVAVQVRLPEVMAAGYGSPFAMRPPDPVPAGGGWVHADLGSPGDADDFERVLSAVPPTASARQIAEEAQAWRLPVCDYRPRAPGTRVPPWRFEAGRPGRRGPAGAGPDPAAAPPLRVLDLTNMWAGPLATWLLQDLGASVVKVEPAFRPDGFRALSGGGIHPGGRPCRPGQDSAMWNALNCGKTIADLDLRSAADRDRFIAMAAASDVVIDSFSPRVMPNFNLDLPAGPLYVSMPAFPPGPQRDWVAYGSGVHACSGLGDAGPGRFRAPAVSYPDPLAGFTAALGILAAVAGRRRGAAVDRFEVSLAESVQPLGADATLTGQGPEDDGPSPGSDHPAIGPSLLERARSLGLTEDRPVCGLPLAHPATVFPSRNRMCSSF
jgi:CoA-transferase family III